MVESDSDADPQTIETTTVTPTLEVITQLLWVLVSLPDKQ